MKFLHAFISNLYRAGADVPAAEYQAWAVQELKALIPFDAALWGMGNARHRKFHNVSVIGLPSNFAAALEQTSAMNPLFRQVASHIGESTRMEDVLPDAEFYASELYHRSFNPFGVERILSTGLADPRSGLYTLFTLYRFDRKKPFSEHEQEIQQATSYHMVAAYSHAFFLHLSRPKREGRRRVSAVVDREAVLHEVEQGFLDLLEKHYPDWRGMNLPFELLTNKASYVAGSLCVDIAPLADLYLVRLHERGPLDRLTARERQVVFAVCRGLSHKAIGRELGLAPTTVSSHLYRAYHKLGVESRSALARLVHHLH